MAYTALKKMREFNTKRFGKEVGPYEPEEHFGSDNSLKSAALRFLHNRCEGLKFDPDKEDEFLTGEFTGKSKNENEIPYNMQMDINRLCLERELERFIDSGVAEDAYNVYYCYMEIFFGNYGKSKKMVELLSEFESNGSSLLMKHRDHYSHSVYVFTLGLAIYETNTNFRKAFKRFYHFDTSDRSRKQDHAAANFFLEYWGITSLFHDIGYPFELPFEQVLSYFEVDKQERGRDSVYIAYRDVNKLTRIPDKAKAFFATKKMYGRHFENTNELFAYDIVQKLGETYGLTESYMIDVLTQKPLSPDSFGYFMDHAWFSASRLFQELIKPDDSKKGISSSDNSKFSVGRFTKEHVDALTAIILHNSLYKFKIAYYKDNAMPNLEMDLHPLAYLLMLCDELQCWDRTAYGRNSRSELHPMSAQFDFSSNEIKATYIYDEEEDDKIKAYDKQYRLYEEAKKEAIENNDKDALKKLKAPRLKAYSDMAEPGQRFRTDIESIVNTAPCKLTVIPKTDRMNRSVKHTYLSGSNFLHLYDFAVSLHSRDYLDMEEEADTEVMERNFEIMALEYKLSNINRAKSFGRYLNAIDCFYTDRPVDFEIVHEFTPEQTAIFAPMEHERWVREHQVMGWKHSEFYESDDAAKAVKGKVSSAALREQLRVHKLAMDGELTKELVLDHYKGLDEKEQGKDWKPFNSMLKLIKKYDGLRIYKLNRSEKPE